ncbi:MAG: hypothetical protein ACM3NW_09525, partial [Syntrophomonadaceae bacterium]
MTTSELVVIAPFAALILVAAAVVLADMVVPGGRTLALVVSFVGLAIVTVLIFVTGQTTQTAFGGAYKVDDLTTFLDLIFVSIAALTLLFAPDYLEPRDLPV